MAVWINGKYWAWKTVLTSGSIQYTVISRSAQTNGFSIGFTLERLISPAPFCGSVYVPQQKAIHLKTCLPTVQKY